MADDECVRRHRARFGGAAGRMVLRFGCNQILGDLGPVHEHRLRRRPANGRRTRPRAAAAAARLLGCRHAHRNCSVGTLVGISARGVMSGRAVRTTCQPLRFRYQTGADSMWTSRVNGKSRKISIPSSRCT